VTALRRDDVTLVLIAKEPVPGRVKTRLCPPCTPEQAAGIAAAALHDTIDAVLDARVGRRVLALEGRHGPWVPDGLDVVAQRGDGLDQRLAAIAADVAGPVVIIGMDTPQVTAAQLDRVVDELCREQVDAVLGPADDGGYWVIALAQPDPGAILGVPMSTDATGAAQLARLEELSLRTAVVESLCDVDTFDEALQVARLVPDSRFGHEVSRVHAAITVVADD